MKRSLLLVLSLVSFFVLVSPVMAVKKWKDEEIETPLQFQGDIYDTLLLLLKGDSLPPVKERNRAQKSAAIHLWRSGGQLSIREENRKEVLLYKNLRVLRSSEVNRVVADEFHRTKGSGARKIACSLKENFVGLSKNRVQDILSRDKLHYLRNARFLNKAIPSCARCASQTSSGSNGSWKEWKD